MVYYGLPLHIIRDVYVTFRSFDQKCRALIRYRQATRNMNERYPDATGEELERMSDRTCIICREEMEAPRLANADQQENAANGEAAAGRPVRNRTAQSLGETPKKLPCGHIFHFRCLRSWLERQQSCPTCRRTVLPEPPAANPIPQNQPLAPQQRVPPAGIFGNQGPVFAPHMLIPNQQPLPNQRMNPTKNDQAGNETPRTDQNETGQTSNGTATETSPPTYNSITSEHIRETLRQGQYPLNGVPHLQSYQAPNGPQMLPGLIPLGQLSNLIPLFPQQPLSYDLESFALSDEQLSVLETETRQALQERLRICEEAQRRLFDVATTLTQALSILPTPLSATPTFVPNPRERPESSLNLGNVQSSSVNEPNPNPTPAIIPSDDVSRRTMEEANSPNSLAQPIESSILEEVENEIGNQESKEDTTSSISPNSTSENDKGKSPEKVVLRTEDEEQEIEKSWTRFEDN
ncbi:hypothetical protein K7432_004529 [Basidiobolus ranarum]|uniref:RING-type E3 ubiquitin transferase n=1 Tax=Basidiobolus ranarum TaxID=34480 RepID=A0ABR2WY54_9FUNG